MHIFTKFLWCICLFLLVLAGATSSSCAQITNWQSQIQLGANGVTKVYDFTPPTNSGCYDCPPTVYFAINYGGGTVQAQTDNQVTIKWTQAGNYTLTMYVYNYYCEYDDYGNMFCSTVLWNSYNYTYNVEVLPVPTQTLQVLLNDCSSKAETFTFNFDITNQCSACPPYVFYSVNGAGTIISQNDNQVTVKWTQWGSFMLIAKVAEYICEADEYGGTNCGNGGITTYVYNVNVVPAPPLIPSIVQSSSDFGIISLSIGNDQPELGYSYDWTIQNSTSFSIIEQTRTSIKYKCTNPNLNCQYLQAKAKQRINTCTAFEGTKNDVYFHPTYQILPSDPNALIDSGNSVLLSINPTPASCSLLQVSSYSWTRNGIYEGNSATFNATQSGDYTAKISFTNGFSYQTPIHHVKSYLEAGNKHYASTRVIRKEGVANSQQLGSLTHGEFLRKTQYMDDAGRAEQTVSMKMSTNNMDVVQPVVYDGLGRSSTTYKPFVMGLDGSYNANAIQNQANFHTNPSNVSTVDAKPYATTKFEASPLGRPIEQTTEGAAWEGKITKSEYTANGANQVMRWDYTEVSMTYFGLVERKGYYPAQTLFVNKITDLENTKTVFAYKDKAGNTVLERVQMLVAPFSVLDTYYVYDGLGKLRLMLPPQAIQNIKEDDLANGGVFVPVTYSTGETTSSTHFQKLKDYVYAHHYDVFGREIMSYLPSVGATYTIYDLYNRPILTQDAQQRISNKWDFVKYDEDGRKIIEGIITFAQTKNQLEMQGIVDNFYKSTTYCGSPIAVKGYEIRANNTEGYTQNLAFPSVCASNTDFTVELLKISYYDDYDFNNTSAPVDAFIPRSNASDWVNAVAPTPFDRNRGSLTGTKVKILNPIAGMPQWLKTVIFYDRQGRVIQTQGDNHLGTKDISSKQYAFDGIVLKEISSHTQPDGTIIEQFVWNKYDLVGKVTDTHHQIKTKKSGATNWVEQNIETLAHSNYNPAGQLVRKDVGVTGDNIFPKANATEADYLQNVDFKYNERGWLTGINTTNLATDPKDLFGMQFFYHNLNGLDIPNLNAVARFDGSLTAATWASKTETNVKRGYAYQYTAINQLQGANYAHQNSAYNENFSIQEINYDLNGNIKKLKQSGLVQYKHQVKGGSPNFVQPTFGQVDDITYAYKNNNQSNQLQTVTDAVVTSGEGGDFKKVTLGGFSDQYTYDNTGSLTSDKNKGVNITYNALGLPATITHTDGEFANHEIRFVYDAVGNKLRQVIADAGTPIIQFDYVNGFLYAGNSSTQRLQFISHEDGRIVVPMDIPSHPGSAQFVYEYFYKDHQGNLRMVYKRTPQTITFNAKFENPVDDTKQGFKNVTDHRTTYPVIEGRRAIGVYEGANQMGPFITLNVSKGDEISMQVKGIYERVSSIGSSTRTLAQYITTMVGTANLINVLQTPGGTDINNKTVAPFNSKNDYSFLLNLGLVFAPKPVLRFDEPNVYLQYVYYNTEGYYVGSQIKMLSKTALLPNLWETLSLQFTAQHDGYVQVFVANESNVRAWFDDMQVSIKPTTVAQENHYSPLGLNLAGIEKLGNPNHRWQLQGKEKLNETGLMYYDFGSRYYDPQLGRWHATDPQNQFASPYNAMGNNFINGTDPNGEVWHLVIGAAIGGAMNLFMNRQNVDNVWTGLKYFGVGAVAGALGAGVGAGVSSALVGGSFSAGFVGSSAALTATSSFWTGAAIGASAGFTSGFANGMGNGFVEGNNLGEASLRGLREGAMGGVMGGVTGGLAGGIDAGADGRNFWHGGRKIRDVALNIPQIDQLGPYDCTKAAGASVDGYYGLGRTQTDFGAQVQPRFPQGLTDAEVQTMYARMGYNVQNTVVDQANPITSVITMADQMNRGVPSIMSYRVGAQEVAANGQRLTFAHATTVSRIKTFSNGKFVIKVMNPSSGVGSVTRFTSLRNWRWIYGMMR